MSVAFYWRPSGRTRRQSLESEKKPSDSGRYVERRWLLQYHYICGTTVPILVMQQLLLSLELDPDNPQTQADVVARRGQGDWDKDRVLAMRDALFARGRFEAAAVLWVACVRQEESDEWLRLAEFAWRDLLDPARAAAWLREATTDGVSRQAARLADELRETDRADEFAAKYAEEARRASDVVLAAGLLIAAAETVARKNPDDVRFESWLVGALHIVPGHPRASLHLERHYRRRSQWIELSLQQRQRAECASTNDARALAWLDVAGTAIDSLGDLEAGREALGRLLALAPEHAAARARLALLPPPVSMPVSLDADSLASARNAASGQPRLRSEPRAAAVVDVRAATEPSGRAKWARAKTAIPDPLLEARQQLAAAWHAAPTDKRAFDAWVEGLRSQTAWNELVDALAKGAQQSSWSADARAQCCVAAADVWTTQIGNPTAAVTALEQALELTPNNTALFDRLKDLYSRRKQWRALIGLLGREAVALDGAVKADKLMEAGRLALERVGDVGLAIEQWNGALLAATPQQAPDIEAALLPLYERDKRVHAQIELLWRSAERMTGAQAVFVWERIATLCAERLRDDTVAREVYRRLLVHEPTHPRAQRFVREHASRQGSIEAIVATYPDVAQRSQLLAALYEAAQAATDQQVRRDVLARAAFIGATFPIEQVRPQLMSVWAAQLDLDPPDERAAALLLPCLVEDRQWQRVLAIYEAGWPTQTGDAACAWARAAKEVCELQVGSRKAAWQWAMRALEIKPLSDERVREALRLAAEPQEVALAIGSLGLSEATNVTWLRWAAQAMSDRGRDPTRAMALWEDVLDADEQDENARRRIEEHAAQRGDVPSVIALRRQRALRRSPKTRVGELFTLASVAHEKNLAPEVVDGLMADVAALDPAHAGVTELRITRLLSAGQNDDALQALREWMARDPNVFRGQLSRALRLASELNQSATWFALIDTGWKDLDTKQRERLLAKLDRHVHAVPAPDPVVARVLRRWLPDANVAAQRARILDRLISEGDVDALRMRFEEARAAEPDQDIAWGLGLRLWQATNGDVALADDLEAIAASQGTLALWVEELGRVVTRLRHDGRDADALVLERRAAAVATRVGHGAGGAEQRWRKLLERDRGDTEAYRQLASIYHRGARWRELSALEWEQLPHWSVEDQELALLRLANRAEEKLGDAHELRRALMALRVLRPQDGDTLQRLADVLAECKDEPARRDVIAEAVELGPLPETRWAFIEQIDYALAAGDVAKAMNLLRPWLQEVPVRGDAISRLMRCANDHVAFPEAYRMAAPILRSQKRWSDLLELARLAAARSDATATTHQQLAELEERHGSVDAAFDACKRAYLDSPDVASARESFLQQARRAGKWPEALRVMRDVAVASPTPGERLARLQSIVAACEATADRQHQREAMDLYRELVELAPNDQQSLRLAGMTLLAHYEAAGQWTDYLAVNDKVAAWATSDSERLALRRRAAQVAWGHAAQTDRAIALWTLVANESGTIADLNELAAVLLTTERYEELNGVWRMIARQRPSRDLLWQIARLEASNLQRPVDAAQTLRELLAHYPEDKEATAKLLELVRREDPHLVANEVVALLRTQMRLGVMAPLDAQVEIARWTELGGTPEDTFAAWCDLLGTAREELVIDYWQRAVANAADAETASRAFGELERAFEANGQLGELVALYEAYPDRIEDRMVGALRIADLRERMGDPGAAFAVLVAMAPDAGEHAELPMLLARIDRLSGELGREGELIDIYRSLAPLVGDADLQRRLYFDLADLLRGVRHDDALARTYYELIVESDPHNQRALRALESIARQAGDGRALLHLLQQRIDGSESLDERLSLLTELAETAGQQPMWAAEAEAAWEQIRQLAPDREDARVHLIPLYSAKQRWHDVSDLLDERLARVVEPREALALQIEQAALFETHLHDLDRAVALYADALQADGQLTVARVALERICATTADDRIIEVAAGALEAHYISHQQWRELRRVYESQLARMDERENKIRLLRYLARLCDEQLEDFDAALEWSCRLFYEVPEERAVRDQIQRLAQITENAALVVRTYSHFVEEGGGDEDTTTAVALLAAQWADQRLGDTDLARQNYAAAWRVAPTDHHVFSARVEFLQRKGPANELRDLYDDALAAGWQGEQAKRLLVERAMFLQIQDPAAAVGAWRDVLSDHRESHVRALAWSGLVAIHRQADDWYALLETISERLQEVDDGFERQRLLVELATVRADKLDDVEGALDELLSNIDLKAELDESIIRLLTAWLARPRIYQRVVEALGDYHRQRGHWRALIGLLEQQAEAADEPATRAAHLRDAALVAADRIGDIGRALSLLRGSWQADVEDDDLLADLVRAHRAHSQLDALLACLDAGLALARTPHRRAAIASQAARIADQERGESHRALAFWQNAHAADADDQTILAELDGLLSRLRQWPALVAVIARRAELADDDAIRLVLLQRLALLHERELGDLKAAAAVWREALQLAENDTAVLAALERIYTQTNDAEELARILEQRLDIETTPMARRVLRQRLSDLCASARGQLDRAIDWLEEQRADQPDEETLARLAALYAEAKRPGARAEVLEAQESLVRSPIAKSQALAEAGHAWADADDPTAALHAFRRAMQLDHSNALAVAGLRQFIAHERFGAQAADELERGLTANNDGDGLVRLYEERLAVSSIDRAEQLAILTRLGQALEHRLRDVAGAFRAAQRRFVLDPSPSSLGGLRRLAEGAQQWTSYATTLADHIDPTWAPDLECAVATELAWVYETKEQDREAAAAWYERAARTGIGEVTALEHAVRLRGADAGERGVPALERLTEISSGDKRIEYRLLLGAAHEASGQAARARMIYAELLASNPRLPGARAALFRALADPNALDDVCPVLEALCKQEANWPKLLDVFEARRAVGHGDQRTLMGEMLEVAELKLSDGARALGYALDRLAQFPEEELLADVLRLGRKTGHWAIIADRLATLTPSVSEPWLAVARGDIALDFLRSPADAYAIFESGFPQGATTELLDGAIRAKRALASWADVAALLERKAATTHDRGVAIAARSEAADLYQQHEKPLEALRVWEQVVAAAPDQQEAWRALCEVAATHASVAAQSQYLMAWASHQDAAAARGTLRRRAQLLLQHSEPDAAQAFRALVDLEPPEVRDLDTLERLALANQDTALFAHSLVRRLRIADTDIVRRRLAETYESMGQAESALQHWQHLAARGDNEAAGAVVRILSGAGQWPELLAELERRTKDDPSNVVAITHMADIWSTRLDNRERALFVLHEGLARHPGAVALVVMQSRLYEQAGDVVQSQQVILDMLHRDPPGVERATLFARLAELAQAQGAEPSVVRDHVRAALDAYASFEPALRMKAQLARQSGNTGELRAALVALVPLVPQGARPPLWRELGLLESQHGRPDDARRALEAYLQVDANDRAVRDALLECYLALGDAAPVLDATGPLLQQAETARVNKDIVLYAGLRGRAFEVAGQPGEALAAYDRALRLMPTDVRALAGAGRIAVATEDWERARRVYRALVLQDLSPKAGISRADAYYQLGLLHQRDGELDKARQLWKRGLEVEPGHVGLTAAMSLLNKLSKG